MTQAQFFQAVSEGSQVAKAEVRAVFQAIEQIVTKNLKKEGKIPLGGLGAVKLVDRKARIGRNPATGEQIKIPAKTVVKVTPSTVGFGVWVITACGVPAILFRSWMRISIAKSSCTVLWQWLT